MSLAQQLTLENGRAPMRLAADMIYPPRCPSCHEYVVADGNFCAECFSKLRMIDAPICPCCGIPFVIAVERDTWCPTCLDVVPEFTVARAAMVYDAISPPLVTALRFHDQWPVMLRYVAMMLRAGRPILEGADMQVPVPLHWRRLFNRKFNQSALLAYHLSEQTGIRCAPKMLRRAVYTKPQMRIDRTTRLKNVKRPFAVQDVAQMMLYN
ncbi:MAG: ComF family protein [Rickettsiales bacterium]